MLNEILLLLNSSRIMSALLMLTMNIGSKYIGRDVPVAVDILFDNFWARMFVIFCIAYISTKDIVISILILLFYILLFSYMLNEKSKSCVLSKTVKNYKDIINNNKKKFNTNNMNNINNLDEDITEEKVIKAKEILRKHELKKKINHDIGDILYF